MASCKSTERFLNTLRVVGRMYGSHGQTIKSAVDGRDPDGERLEKAVAKRASTPVISRSDSSDSIGTSPTPVILRQASRDLPPVPVIVRQASRGFSPDVSTPAIGSSPAAVGGIQGSAILRQASRDLTSPTPLSRPSSLGPSSKGHATATPIAVRPSINSSPAVPPTAQSSAAPFMLVPSSSGAMEPVLLPPKRSPRVASRPFHSSSTPPPAPVEDTLLSPRHRKKPSASKKSPRGAKTPTDGSPRSRRSSSAASDAVKSRSKSRSRGISNSSSVSSNSSTGLDLFGSGTVQWRPGQYLTAALRRLSQMQPPGSAADDNEMEDEQQLSAGDLAAAHEKAAAKDARKLSDASTSSSLGSSGAKPKAA